MKHSRLLVCKLLTLTALIICNSATNSGSAVEIHMPDVQASSKRCQSGVYVHLFEHLNQLSKLGMYKKISGAAMFPNMGILSSLQKFHIHLGANTRDWNIFAEFGNQDHLRKWWQNQLRSLQKVIRGFGIQRNGMRISVTGAQLRIEGIAQAYSEDKNLAPQWAENNNDLYITYPQFARIPFNFKENGIESDFHLPGTPTTQYVDLSLLQRLPQDIFCWIAIVVDQHTRPTLLALADTLENRLAGYGAAFADKKIHRILTASDGTILIGLSLSKKSTDINITWARNPLVDAECASFAPGKTSILSSNDRNNPDLVIIKGEKYWAVSSNISIAQHLSGKRTVHFPQRLPDSLGKNKQLTIGFYANTVALAQSYYRHIQKFKKYGLVPTEHDQQNLLHSLEQLIPYLRPASASISARDTGWDIQATHIGITACMLSGHLLHHNNTLAQNNIARKKLLAAFKSLTAMRMKNKSWPKRLHTSDNWLLCYLQPRDDDGTYPILFASPTISGGNGCLAIHGNGSMRYFPGRSMWQRAQLLEKRDTGTDQSDWVDIHPEFTALKKILKINNIDAELQLLLQQIELRE